MHSVVLQHIQKYNVISDIDLNVALDNATATGIGEKDWMNQFPSVNYLLICWAGLPHEYAIEDQRYYSYHAAQVLNILYF